MLRFFVGRYALSYPLLVFWKQRIVNRRTEICLEGYQRSGNTFFHEYFKLFNKECNIADHVHTTYQLRRAIKKKIPTVVIIRNPRDVILSGKVSNEQLSISVIAWTYKKYLQYVLEMSDEMLIVRFEEVISHPQQIVISINERYNTTFEYEELTEIIQENLFSIISCRHHMRGAPVNLKAVPSKKKFDLKEEYANQLKGNNSYHLANLIYSELLEKINK